MIARRTSKCPVCDERIEAGDEIASESGIGWMHKRCWRQLDEPVKQDPFHVQFYGDHVLTVRDRAIYDSQLPYDLGGDDPDAYPLPDGIF